MKKYELDSDDKAHIAGIFHEEVVPKLMVMDARIGNINCEFAGEKYKHWVLEFRSARSGFKIIDFEYDEDSRSFELPQRQLIRDNAKDA
jgi:hypothetical protein